MLTCPECVRAQDVELPSDHCQYFYDRLHCRAVTRPKEGDDCVFCSYADKVCPPRLAETEDRQSRSAGL